MLCEFGSSLRKELVHCYIWSTTFYGAEIVHFGKWMKNNWEVVNCGAGETWRRLDRTDHVRNEELRTVKENRNILDEIKRKEG
jgi:hypothetical protein